jgi:hypothetical protein
MIWKFYYPYFSDKIQLLLGIMPPCEELRIADLVPSGWVRSHFFHQSSYLEKYFQYVLQGIILFSRDLVIIN